MEGLILAGEFSWGNFIFNGPSCGHIIFLPLNACLMARFRLNF